MSTALAAQVLSQFGDWKRGVAPSRAPLGRGGQNPRLLLLFERLEQVEAATQAEAGRG